MLLAALAVLLALLAALTGAVLLLLLAGFLAATLLLAGLIALLLAGFLAALLLTATLLLAGLIALLLARFLVRILVHWVVLSNVGAKFTSITPRPNAKITRRHLIEFRILASNNAVGTGRRSWEFPLTPAMKTAEGRIMGRYLLLWLLGVPLPILFLIWIFGGLH